MNKTKTLCLHHNDADGICAGAIVKHFEQDVVCISMNYGYDVPWKKIEEAEYVYMVDFGLQPFSDMIRLLEMKKSKFIWIDHHITAIQEMEKHGRHFEGIREVGRAGCELTWDWFTGEHCEETMPKIVRYIGRYDVWDTNYHPDLFNLQSALRYYDIDVDNDAFWTKHFLDNSKLDEVIEIGKICNKYQDNLNQSYANSHSFELEWEGYRFIACNAMNTNSKLFDTKFDHNRHDAMMIFGYTNKNWTVSMYTTKPGIDVGAVAKRQGGGGHKGASGFQCNELPFKLKFK